MPTDGGIIMSYNIWRSIFLFFWDRVWGLKQGCRACLSRLESCTGWPISPLYLLDRLPLRPLECCHISWTRLRAFWSNKSGELRVLKHGGFKHFPSAHPQSSECTRTELSFSRWRAALDGYNVLPLDCQARWTLTEGPFVVQKASLVSLCGSRPSKNFLTFQKYFDKP